MIAMRHIAGRGTPADRLFFSRGDAAVDRRAGCDGREIRVRRRLSVRSTSPSRPLHFAVIAITAPLSA